MIFKEFTNPEENNYDITSSFNEDGKPIVYESSSYYQEQLIDLIGILEDVSEDELIDEYGITLDEYYNPTKETIIKVNYKLETKAKKNR